MVDCIIINYTGFFCSESQVLLLVALDLLLWILLSHNRFCCQKYHRYFKVLTFMLLVFIFHGGFVGEGLVVSVMCLWTCTD